HTAKAYPELMSIRRRALELQTAAENRLPTQGEISDLAAAMDPESAMTWQTAGDMYYNACLAGPAMESYQRAIQISPDITYAYYYRLAWLLMRQGSHNEALDVIEKYLELDPD